ncbi:TraR/DksA family transcriptional regulator [Nocardioides cavernaquae]|uniref:DNA-binding protein n=1 Tax=Nocardioides cavernaquae TaxID=2321396 RepID=A0A3A5HHW9_9ACTN|nr:DNA-binding protein [Nocardioides cavernaquae]
MARSSRKTLTGSAVTAAKKVIGRRPRSEDVVEAATGAAKKAASSAAKKAAPTAKKAASSAAKKAAPTAKKAATSAAKKAAPVAKKAASDAAKKAAPVAKKAAASAAKKAATSAVKRATPARKPATRARGAAGLAVLEGEDAWTKAELDEVLAELNEHAARLRRELQEQEEELAGLLRDAGDGAGHDQADMGATSFERDQELSVVANAREMLAQTERALSRIADGSYGVCESCGNPIGKMRVMAFPRATLCMSCKQREERR